MPSQAGGPEKTTMIREILSAIDCIVKLVTVDARFLHYKEC